MTALSNFGHILVGVLIGVPSGMGLLWYITKRGWVKINA